MADLEKRQVIRIQFEAQVQWVVARDIESGTYVGACPALNLNAVGDTWEDFIACANEATQLLFEELFAENELEAFLRRMGWQIGPLPAPGTLVKFDVPFDLRRGTMDSVLAATQ